ncbi:hypothetical protein [Herbiconiux solani]|uniref:hypothetical protein n=1 Tax=Herbiconiux solani TaxID=661329 RepID=UPI0008245404|nr:hypothetical protein [Herbiconiux solani]
MKRVEIVYDGEEYTIGDRDVDDVQAEIQAGLTGAEPAWLVANRGEGRMQEARLLITEGVGISLVGIDEPDQTAP